MNEKDTSGRVPRPRQPQRQASLHEVLSATAEQAAERARFIVGNNGQRRIAGYMRELVDFAATTLATKWGVDPRVVPAQEVRTMHIVYQKPAIAPKQLSNSEPMIRQRSPSNHQPVDERDTITPATEQQIADNSTLTNSHEIALANVLLENPLRKAIAIVRRNRKLSQQVFGELVGISKSLVDKMERGTRLIKPGLVQDICDILELDEASTIRKILMEKALEEERIRRVARQIRRKTTVVSPIS